MPTESQPAHVPDLLAELIADARQLPAPMLPRPRTASPGTIEPRVVDLTETAIRIPESTASLIVGCSDYGA